MLDPGVDLDVWPWIWQVIAVGFALIELTVLGGSFVLLPFAVSAFVAAILAYYDAAIEVQWFVFLLGGGLLFVVMARWARGFLRENVLPRVSVLTAIAPKGSRRRSIRRSRAPGVAIQDATFGYPPRRRSVLVRRVRARPAADFAGVGGAVAATREATPTPSI